MTDVRRSGRFAAVAVAMGLLGSLMVWNGRAEGVAYPGLNGLLACTGATLPGVDATSVNNEVYTINPSGGPRNILTSENIITDYNPIWTPDGTKILYETEFLTQAVDDTFELMLMNPDGTNKTPLLINGRPEDIPKGYHPDGAWIVMSSNRDGNNEIYKMRSDATDQTRLTNNTFSDSWPRWSPDGTRIVFQSNRSGNSDIWLMDSFGNNPVNLTNTPAPANESTPEWSPDGTKIVYTRTGNGNDVWVMNADGSNQVSLTANSAVYDAIPSWSPDGTLIAFTSVRDNGDFEVYRMNADGSGVTRLTFAQGFDGRCDWQRVCTITGSGQIAGTRGDDVICGSSGNDDIAGQGGNDIISGFGGADRISAGPGNDTMFGGDGTDQLVGGDGNDFSSAGPGADHIVANTGERIDPGGGADTCYIGRSLAPCPPRLS